jgi:O-antigen/teichoic acid export membrane protein
VRWHPGEKYPLWNQLAGVSAFLGFNRSGLLVAIGKFASAQVVIQGIGFICGIVAVRLLSTEQYALYILANTFLGTLAVLADSGITSGAMSQGGKVWRDPKMLGAVLATSLRLRKRFALWSGVVVLPILALLLVRHGANWVELSMILVCVAALFQLGLGTSIYEIPAKLHQCVGSIGRIRATMGVARLALILGFLLVWAKAPMALLAGVLPQWFAIRSLHRMSRRMVDWGQPPDSEVEAETLRIVRKVLPGSIFYCVSGQLSVFLISFSGTTMALAQVGAIGRLTQIFSLVSTLCAVVAVPRFARIQDTGRLVWAYLAMMGSVFGVCMALVGGAIFFERQALWILGPSYAGLHVELVLAVSGGALNILTGFAYGLGSSRGWISNPWATIGLCLAGQIALISTMDLGTARGVLLFNLLAGVIPFGIQFGYNFWRSNLAASNKKALPDNQPS